MTCWCLWNRKIGNSATSFLLVFKCLERWREIMDHAVVIRVSPEVAKVMSERLIKTGI